MDLTFDYYKNLEEPTFYLCNPDMRPISAITARNRNITLRFNDLSELTFEVPKIGTDAKGNSIEFPYYSRIETRRLIYIEGIGWFQIVIANEIDDGEYSYKNVRAESHQAAFKELGFYKEGRLYKFYDERDPYDENYDDSDPSAIPSIVGQLHKQLGIKVDLLSPANTDMDDWTITYISPAVWDNPNNATNIRRSFSKAESTYGYDFMINAASDAFEVIFDFDILHHTIKIKRVAEVTERSSIYLAFDNLVKEVNLEEKSSDIVTVLTCTGTDLDIRTVNPTGTNYIADFSYYMDEEHYHWMSAELIEKLKAWKTEVSAQRVPYSQKVLELRSYYEKTTYLSTNLPEMSLKLQDLEAVRDAYIAETADTNAIFTAETVLVEGKSLDENSNYHTAAFDPSATKTCYRNAPVLTNGIFVYSGANATASFTSNMLNEYLYFSDTTENTSYCKLTQASRVNDDAREELYVAGFERYAITKDVSVWIDYQTLALEELNAEIAEIATSIESKLMEMETISTKLNIQNYLADEPKLLRELKFYWVEGEYNSDTLAVLDSTTQEGIIDLANELLADGERQLSKTNQPRFSFKVSAVNFLRIYEFEPYIKSLALGKVITIEKNENTRYYPALTEMSFSFDDADVFELGFSNSLKMNGWGFTYADMLAKAAGTTRTVTANWNEMMDYSNNKLTINELLVNPLDRTLRAAQDNMYNQNFIVDKTGILGRKHKENEALFEDEQMRVINNVILFTDDGWKTAKTALGKISYTDDGTEKTAYGLLAEVIVGKLIMGERLSIFNSDNSISLDNAGITVKNASSGETVFNANSDGTVTVKGAIYATSLALGTGVTIDYGKLTGTPDLSKYVIIQDGYMQSGNYAHTPDEIYSTAGMRIDLANRYIRTPNFAINTDGSVNLKGSVTATSGKIGNCLINSDGSISSANGGFTVDAEGYITAIGGKIGGLTLEQVVGPDGTTSRLYSDNFQIGSQTGIIEGVYKTTTSLSFTPSDSASALTTTKVSESSITTRFIETDELVITSGELSANTIYVGELTLNGSTLSGGSTAITMNEAGASRSFYAEVSYEDTYNMYTVTVKIFDSLTSRNPLNLYNASTFVIHYLIGMDTSPTATSITIPAGSSEGTVLISKQFWGIWDRANIWFASSGVSKLQQISFSQSTSSTNIGFRGSLLPSTDNTYTLGSGAKRWNDIYTNNAGNIGTSDIALKNTISDIDEKYSDLFDRLRPVTYKFNDGNSNRLHTGLIANEVKAALDELGISTKDFAAYCSWIKEDGKEGYGLRYGEFISLCISEIQKLKIRIKDLDSN